MSEKIQNTFGINNSKEKNRSTFSGKVGFVLAAAGSAVGLGNIWRFPYLAAKYGGGIFLLVYVILAVTFGFSLMVTEIAIGRKTRLSAIGAFRSLDRRFSFLGALASAIPMIILSYYTVIGGWVTKYAAAFAIEGAEAAAQDTYFSTFIGKAGEPVAWHFVFFAVTALIVLFGVEKGIERVSKWLMPALVILMLGIALYTVFAMDGAWEGVIYYLKPDFSKFSMMTVVAALGQLFYSMSLAMGIMVTYGSYMKSDISIERSAHQIEWFDTGIAFLAGLMVIPAVFSFSGGDEAALGQGPGLMFVTLPKVFATMPSGRIIGLLFFVMVFFAALTSAISLMETVVSVLMDKLKLNRRLVCLLVFGVCFLLGLPSSLGYSLWSSVKLLGMQFLDFFDFISNNLLMPVTAFLTCIFIGFFQKPKTVIDEIALSGSFRMQRVYPFVIRWVAPACILLILVSSILNAFGVLVI